MFPILFSVASVFSLPLLTLHKLVVAAANQPLLPQTNDRTEVTWPADYRVFPSQLVSAKEDKNSILVFLACIEGCIWTVEFVEGMLKGKESNTFEGRTLKFGRDRHHFDSYRL
jgi:hypothetical protein